MKAAMKALVIVVMMSIIALSFVYADDAKSLDEKFFHKAHFILKSADELGLTADQLDKVQALKLKVKRSLIQKEAEIDIYALDIKAALGKDNVNVSAVNNLIDKKYEIKKQKAKELVDAYVSLRGILSKEQYEKLKEEWQKQAVCKMGESGRHEGRGCAMMGREKMKK